MLFRSVLLAYDSAKAPISRFSFVPDLEKFANHSFRDARDEFAIRHDVSTCQLTDAEKREIADYRDIVARLIQAATQGSWKGRTYANLATFVDKFGARVSGSQMLEDSIDYILEKMKADGLESHGEEAIVPHWIR